MKIDNDQNMEKIKILLPAIFLGLIVTFGILKLASTGWSQYVNFRTNKQQWEKDIADNKTKVNYFNAVDQDRLRQMETILNEAVFKQDKSYYLVGVIKKIAEEYGFVIDGFEAQVGELGKGKVAMNVESVDLKIKVKLIGPREKYLDLVTRIERTLPVLSIENFEIKSASNVIGIETNVSAFFIPKAGEAKIDNLSLNDLVLSEKELKLIGELEKYQKYSGADEGSAITTYTNFQKTNPFLP